MHLDALNQPIEVGDQVIITKSGTTTLYRGTVTKLTDKKVTVERTMYGRKETVSKAPDTMVVINKQHEYALATWPELYI